MLHEIIVVEGRDDVTAVKRAVEAEVIATHGFGFGADVIARLHEAQRRRGVIILTDPDSAGARIRRRLDAILQGRCKHAHLPRHLCATPNGGVGVEHASPDAIRDALALAHPTQRDPREEFTALDLQRAGLNGHPDAAQRRRALGERLGLGFSNARQLLARLNHYGISRDEFDDALRALDHP